MEASRSRSATRLRLGVLLAVALVLGLVPLWGAAAQEEAPNAACPAGTPAGGFVDIGGNTHETNINCLAFLAITQGVTATRYEPGSQVRRDQMASFIARALEAAGYGLPAAGPAGFTDTAGNVHRQRIDQLAAAGIVRGTSATTYDPAGVVRRDQMASFLVRAAEWALGTQLTAGSAPFTDVAGNVHAGSIGKAFEAGLVRGRTATTYEPASGTRRDQMASFLVRLVDLLWADQVAAPQIILDRDQVEAGRDLAGRVTGDTVDSVSLSGCGLDDEDLDLDANGRFSVTVPANAPVGECELVFTVVWDDGTGGAGVQASALVTTVIRITINVVAAATPGAPGAPGTPGGNPAQQGNFTDAPELVQVTKQAEGTDWVRYGYRFDQTVAPDGLDPARFFLNLWDGSRIQGISAIRDDAGNGGGSANVVRVVFPKDPVGVLGEGVLVNPLAFALRNWVTHAGATAHASSTLTEAAATTASVANQAVRSAADDLLVNPEGSFPLQSQTLTAARSQFPNLTGITGCIFQNEAGHPQALGNSCLFQFDRPVVFEEIEVGLTSGPSPDTHVGFGLILRGTVGNTAAEQGAGALVLRGYKIAHPNATSGTGFTFWPADTDRIRVFFESAALNPAHGTAFLHDGVIADVARAYVYQGAFDATSGGLFNGLASLTDASGEAFGDGPGPVTTANINHGGQTRRPDLTGAAFHDVFAGGAGPAHAGPRPAGDRALLTFSEAVYNPYAPAGALPGSDEFRVWDPKAWSAFHAYHFNGLRVEALYAERFGQNGNQVLVTFPPGTLSDSDGNPNKSVVGYGVGGWADYTSSALDTHRHDCKSTQALWPACEHSAAVRSTGNETLNEPGVVGVARTFAGGETLAPNLQRVEIEVTGFDFATGEVIEYTVTYIFDRAVSPDDAGNAVLTLYDRDGVRRTATSGFVFPAGSPNVVEVKASSAAGGFSLIAGSSARIGGVVWHNVHNNPVHVLEGTGLLSVLPALPLLPDPLEVGYGWDQGNGAQDRIVNYETTKPVR